MSDIWSDPAAAPERLRAARFESSAKGIVEMARIAKELADDFGGSPHWYLETAAREVTLAGAVKP